MGNSQAEKGLWSYFHPCSLTHDACKSSLPLLLSVIFMVWRLYSECKHDPRHDSSSTLFGLFGLIAPAIITDLLKCLVIIDFRSKSMYANKPFLILEQTVPSVLHLGNQLWTIQKRLKSEALSSVTNKRGRLTKCVHSSLMERNHQLL